MKKLLSLVLAAMMLLTATFALADMTETTNDDGTTTVTTDNGATFTYSKDDFSVIISEDGTVEGVYLPETAESVYFTIKVLADTDAASYMAGVADAFGTEVMTDSAFFNEPDTVEWFVTDCEASDGENTITTSFYARNFDGGCYVVAVYSFYENNANEDAEVADEDLELASTTALEQVLGSLSFAK